MNKELSKIMDDLGISDAAKELARKNQKNTPIRRNDMRDVDGKPLPVQRALPTKDKKVNDVLGAALPLIQTMFPTNRERREVKQAPRGSGGNRKATRGRKIQMVDKTVKVKIGNITVNEPTGFVKRVVHKVAFTKVNNSLANNKGYQAYQSRLNEEAAAALEATAK